MAKVCLEYIANGYMVQSEEWLRKIHQHSWKSKQRDALSGHKFCSESQQILWILLHNKDLLV